jgi:GNAT superfamily N-acetyltransferase
MDIILVKAKLNDAEFIHAMQIKAFRPLLERYQDLETNPANEPLEKVVARIKQSFTDYYIIKSGGTFMGGIRIAKMENKRYRVSPVFILPEYQGNGLAQKVFHMIEQVYFDAKTWELDTILEEPGNCHLYEKLGYKKTGQTKIVNARMTLVFYEKQLDQ